MICLLAERSTFLHVGDRFREANALSTLLGAGAVVLAIAAIGLTIWLWTYRSRRLAEYRVNAPRALFDELCRGHGLRWSERRLLQQLAVRLKLDHEARLFLEPELWQSAAAHLPPAQKIRTAELQRRLRG